MDFIIVGRFRAVSTPTNNPRQPRFVDGMSRVAKATNQTVFVCSKTSISEG
jgi:hypothetical protein